MSFSKSLLASAFLFGFGVHAATAAALVIDNGDFGSGYAVSGVTEQPIGDAFGGDQAFNNTGGNLTQNATYTFTGLTVGTYEVYASWRLNGQANADFMQVAVSDGGPTVSFNQTNIGPLADLVINDGSQDMNFQSVGQVVVTDGGLVVTTSLGLGGAQQFFINDAVAIDLIPEPSGAVLTLLGLSVLGLRRRRR